MENLRMKYGLAFALCLTSSSLFAHPVFEKTIVHASTVFKAEMMITHGCGDSGTVKLIVEIPEEVIAVTPQAMTGWNIETVESTLSAPREVFGMTRTKYTSKVIWSGNRLSNDFFDVFSFIIIPPADVGTLYFPTTQICEVGEDAYTTIPDPHSDEYVADAAPALTVVMTEAAVGH
jgi:uncharacterized protein YcnI